MPTKSQLIPRANLFGNPTRTQVRISPDGKSISWLQPKDGVLNVFVAPLDRLADAMPVTDDKKRGVRVYFWSLDSKSIRYPQDKDGDENWHIHAVEPGHLASPRDLTPYGAVRAQIVRQSFERELSALCGAIGEKRDQPRTIRHGARG